MSPHADRTDVCQRPHFYTTSQECGERLKKKKKENVGALEADISRPFAANPLYLNPSLVWAYAGLSLRLDISQPSSATLWNSN